MASSKKASDIITFIEENNIEFIDYRFTDIFGRHAHLTVPTKGISEKTLMQGPAIDGSSFPAWKDVHSSDILLSPDFNTAVCDPFFKNKTLILFCSVIDPTDGKGYDRDPRTIALRAENYLKTSPICDQAFFGPELEFFVFDKVSWHVDPTHNFYRIESGEAPYHWANDQCNGYQNALKGAYMALPPSDTFHDLRSSIAQILIEMNVPVEVHHHEVASFGQCEIGTRFSTLVERSDWVQLVKYVVKNAAHQVGKTATFMPKPIMGDNGSGMHCHQSLWKDGKNLFSGTDYIGLSQTALFYIGGILKHACALSAFTNPSVNSYRRLMPGYEAPVRIAYSARNRSAAIRVPYSSSETQRRIETRFPDALANPYLAQTALLLAGLDGVQNQIDPGKSTEKNLYQLSLEESRSIPCLPLSLGDALDALDRDRDFLVSGGIFSHDFLDSYIQAKKEEIRYVQERIHPVEFELYYNG